MRERKYGLTTDQFNDLLTKQNNQCAICSRGFVKTPNVDHDHNTGKVRGLLCTPCNNFLGYIGDSVISLQRAEHYVGRFQ